MSSFKARSCIVIKPAIPLDKKQFQLPIEQNFNHLEHLIGHVKSMMPKVNRKCIYFSFTWRLNLIFTRQLIPSFQIQSELNFSWFTMLYQLNFHLSIFTRNLVLFLILV